MCCGSNRLNPKLPSILPSPSSSNNSRPSNTDMNHLTVEIEDNFASFLELAANNDVEGFKRMIECDPSGVNEVGLWYGRQKGSKQMVFERRTPLMVAATYGSIDVLKLILSLSKVDINESSGVDKCTALHCAASGGSTKAVEVVKLLLENGADPDLVDANGHRAIDVVTVPRNFQEIKLSLEKLLKTNGFIEEDNLRVSESVANSNSSQHSLSSENRSPSPALDSLASPSESPKFNDLPTPTVSDKKEYPIDPSLPDIKNSIYSTDEFRMFSFKVRPCSRAYSHDWTECPFVHPGENARRRDPRKFHYSCVPCPEFRKGACRRGDMCEYAHGVFESWLHPAQYRTRFCKDGTNCNRRVCFFAHTQEELRPLYVSTGSAVHSPRSASVANAMDFAASMNLLPGSPSSVSVMSPSPFTPPMSPSANGMSNMGWSQPNVPILHLPGSNLQSSRLRASLNARDIPVEDVNVLRDFDVQPQFLLNELSPLSLHTNSFNHSGSAKNVTPSNLADLFSAESSSPRYTDKAVASAVFSPTHRSVVLNQFQQQQGILSPINTNYSPKNVEHSLSQVSFGVPSSGRMSPRSVDPMSPISSQISILEQRGKQKQFRSLSSRELGLVSANIVGSPVDSWSNWRSSNEKPDWAVNTEDSGRLQKSSSFDLGNNGEEPDLSWVQLLVKESPQEIKEKSAMRVSSTSDTAAFPSEDSNFNWQIEQLDQSALGEWIEQMQLDQVMAQNTSKLMFSEP